MTACPIFIPSCFLIFSVIIPECTTSEPRAGEPVGFGRVTEISPFRHFDNDGLGSQVFVHCLGLQGFRSAYLIRLSIYPRHLIAELPKGWATSAR